jgi:hypothetical protein
MTIPKEIVENISTLHYRDMVAMVAMHGMVSSLQPGETLRTEGTALWAYQMADAMIEASNGTLVEPEEEAVEEDEGIVEETTESTEDKPNE